MYMKLKKPKYIFSIHIFLHIWNYEVDYKSNPKMCKYFCEIVSHTARNIDAILRDVKVINNKQTVLLKSYYK